jgi:hypothetical protein
MEKNYSLEIYWEDGNKILYEMYHNLYGEIFITSDLTTIRRECAFLMNNGYLPKQYEDSFTYVRVGKIIIKEIK